MNQTCYSYVSTGQMASQSDFPQPLGLNPQTALLDAFFPGFSLFSTAVLRYSKIDLTVYIPTLLVIGLLGFGGHYLINYFWEFANTYLMSSADVRIDDEMYNMLMAWIANQQFAKRSRRFVANTNLNSRMWFLWREFDSDDEKDEGTVELDAEGNAIVTDGKGKKGKKVQFTPSFGTHYFWYKRRLLIFKRSQDTRQAGWGPVSEREEICVQCFGRNPAILKELLDDCRKEFISRDENRTIIYRGGLKSGSSEPTWTRCVSRVSRPFSTVVLDETVKKNVLDDMRDYLHPYTKRWYSNRGIPYRRGYLLYGPPGTGKSSLSFAIAGYFKLKIYIVSLNSLAMNEENLGTLFAELPQRCVVLLEDIDTAGLTHTRAAPTQDADEAKPKVAQAPGDKSTNLANLPANNGGRISLSALLNIIDGVAATEGRILIMTTNHLEKLDAALIRPGRVDMTIKFDLATTEMISTIFRGIFATLEGDVPSTLTKDGVVIHGPKQLRAANGDTSKLPEDAEQERIKEEAAIEAKKKAEEAKVFELGTRFAQIIPAMTFSPAEIQGYLLKHKREPEIAVRDAADWVVVRKAEQIREKEQKALEEKERAEKEEKERREKEKEEAKEKAKGTKEESAKADD